MIQPPILLACCGVAALRGVPGKRGVELLQREAPREGDEAEHKAVRSTISSSWRKQAGQGLDKKRKRKMKDENDFAS
jgi:hypothetical protein